MSSTTNVVDVSRLGPRRGVRAPPKGRPVDPAALAEVQAALGDAPRRADLLIEHLHRLQDRYGCLRAPHLVALAAEMKLAMAEVYEVASFYHHFDIVKDGDAPPPPITVRVCGTLSCAMAGADALRVAAADALGAGACCRRPASGGAITRLRRSSAAIRWTTRRCRRCSTPCAPAQSSRRRRPTSITPRIARPAATRRGARASTGSTASTT